MKAKIKLWARRLALRWLIIQDGVCEKCRAEKFPETVVNAASQVDRGTFSFEQLRSANIKRCEESFHSIDGWTPWEWSNAMAGEVGEACNLTKKMARVWPSNKLIKVWDDKTLAQLQRELELEIADVVIYADLLATRIGKRLEDCIREKFDITSEKIGSTVRLNASLPGEVK